MSLTNDTNDEQQLLVPERFEKLFRHAEEHNLKTIIEPVSEAIEKINDIYDDMRSGGGGAFLIWRGHSGAGKSTFLHTINLFLDGVEIESIPNDAIIQDYFKDTKKSLAKLRVIVIEGREALLEVSEQVLEAGLHSINSYLRSEKGENTLIVWPCNTDDLADRLVNIASKLGAESLLGTTEPIYRFSGPPKEHFVTIASKTVHVLNNGASLIDLGVSDEEAHRLASNSSTIGQYLTTIRQELRKKQKQITKLLAAERCRLWIVVAAGTDPDGDVAALTRGQVLSADVERMLSATSANVVEELKKHPEQIGILGAVLDAKILHLPMLTSLEIMRDFGSATLHDKMRTLGLAVKGSGKSATRVSNGDLGTTFQNKPSGLRAQGRKAGSNTLAAFEKLTLIAETNDKLLNRALGDALVAAKLITSYKIEVDLGNGLTRRSDLLCMTNTGPVRVELMWRRRTSRAEIANYVLTKLYNYGKAIRFLS